MILIGFWFKGILVLAATNRPYAIDAALMRPGRFDLVSPHIGSFDHTSSEIANLIATLFLI